MAINNSQNLWLNLTLSQKIEMEKIAKTGRYDDDDAAIELELLHLVFISDLMRKRASLTDPLGRQVLRAGNMQFYRDWWKELDAASANYLLMIHKNGGHTNIHPPDSLFRTLVNPYGAGYTIDEKGADLVEAWVAWQQIQPDTLPIELDIEVAALLSFWRDAISNGEIVRNLLKRDITDGETLKVVLVFTHMSIANLSNPMYQAFATSMTRNTLAIATAIALNICPDELPRELFDAIVKAVLDIKEPPRF